MQSSSFLEFQRKMEEKEGRNNANSLFGIDKIPSDNHIRDILDSIEPICLKPLYNECLNYLKEAKILNSYKHMNKYLVALDGTGYHSSKTIKCSKCLTKEYKDEQTTYSHQAITPVIVSPNINKVISLMPELIENSDGTKKQDCEINASKRWLKHNKLLNLDIILLGDDLYAHEPFAREALQGGHSFIFVAKEDSHKVMYEHISLIAGDSRFYKYANEFHENKNIDKLIDNMKQEIYSDDNVYRWVRPDNFKNDIREHFEKYEGWYSWKGLKYLLYEYELFLQEKSKGEIKLQWEEINKETIEHIYPQTPKDKCWEDNYSQLIGKKRSRKLHALGNLVLLSTSKNSSLKNKCFNDKKEIFFKGSYSEIEVSQNGEWTPEIIDNRSKKILLFLSERWDLIVDDEIIDSLI